jgi:hypothetical protein
MEELTARVYVERWLNLGMERAEPSPGPGPDRFQSDVSLDDSHDVDSLADTLDLLTAETRQ